MDGYVWREEEMGRMRVAVVGAGLAGLATAAAFNRTGHDVSVYEQADALRSSGLAINLWSNATSLLPGLGIPAEAVPGEPFARMLFRAAGRQVATAELPARGLPHVTVERGALLDALAATLPDDAIGYGVRRTDVDELAGEHDLVVVADGTNSTLRSAVTGPVGRRWSWRLWQANVAADLPEVPPGTGAAVTRPGLFSGIWRLAGKRVTWFVEQPGRESGDGDRLLDDLRDDEDPALRTLAVATPAKDWVEWHAQDMWPRRQLHRGNVVLVGDAAHAMLPTLGQGACQSVEDAATLAASVAAGPDLDRALRRYEAARVPRLRWILALTRAGALGRRPGVTSRTVPAVAAARMMARSGGAVLRRLSRPRIPVPR
ncbi:MAG: FAD-dependent monooxygenase [Streptosporangiales bacterium]|nr:FAD-dependent monooxygenase [Streptosporangiales bacterium]